MSMIRVLSPIGEVRAESFTAPALPSEWTGRTVGFIDNTKHNSDQLLMRIASILEKEHGAKSHVIRRKKSAGSAPSPEMIAEYKQNCDNIVAGVGD